MNRPLRLMMGVGIVAILLPSTALIMPDAVSSLVPWHSDQSLTNSELALSAATPERDPTLAAESTTTTRGTELVAQTQPLTDETAPKNELEGSNQSSTSDVGPDTDETKTAPTPDHNGAHDSSPTSEAQDPTSTTDSQNTSESKGATSGSQTSKTITGTACPCTVNGTTELKGDVDLKGDLIVDGGTLVARSGVNVNGNGFQIMFMNGGRADFQGTEVFTWSNRGAKQNLKRDINFRNLRRIVWMENGGASTLKYLAIVDSGTPTLGDYPLHWHLNGNSTRGTIVEGVVVLNGRNRAYVPHGSHGITFRNVIAKNTNKDPFWWDWPGTNDCSERRRFCTADNSNDIVIERALVDGASIPHGQSDHHTVAGFVLGAGSGNAIRNSVAINIKGGQNCSGYHWTSKANLNEGGNVWAFRNNFSQSADCHGIFVWQNDFSKHVIDGFTGGGIDHGAYENLYEYRNFDVPYVTVEAAGWKMRDGRIGTVRTTRHKSDAQPTVSFTDVAIDRFVVANGNGSIPGYYVLNNTGLACDDIEYPDVVDGTKVIIDGNEC